VPANLWNIPFLLSRSFTHLLGARQANDSNSAGFGLLRQRVPWRMSLDGKKKMVVLGTLYGLYSLVCRTLDDPILAIPSQFFFFSSQIKKQS
jgi:hypothetical protein